MGVDNVAVQDGQPLVRRPILGSSVNFTTGPLAELVTSPGSPGGPPQGFAVFQPGGTIEIIGGVFFPQDLPPQNLTVPLGTVLFQGSYTEISSLGFASREEPVQGIDFPASPAVKLNLGMGIQGTLAPSLAAALQIPGGTYIGRGLTGIRQPNTSGPGPISGEGYPFFLNLTPIPEPGTVLLLGSGFIISIAIVLVRLRRGISKDHL